MKWDSKLETELQQQRSAGLWRDRSLVQSPQGTEVLMGDQWLLNFCSNDYLNLNSDPEVIDAGISALSYWGAGSGASHLLCGHNEVHHQLEHRLAEFVGADRAMVFSTGYMANLAIPQTFLRRQDLLIQDKLNHASLIDAGRMTNADFRRYPHGNVEWVERLLADSAAHRKMLMTDGVFSMDGDIAKLRELVEICQRFETMLVVDDAHGLGVLGKSGAGSLELNQIPVKGQVVMVGTLGKACGTFGAFVAGDESIIESLIQFGRTYIYTTAMPPVIAAMTVRAIDIIQQQPHRRQRLLQNIAHFRSQARSAGICLADSITAIQPILFSSATAPASTLGTAPMNRDDPSIAWVMHVSRHLLQAGIWVAAIRPPTVPAGTARLRVTLTAGHTTEQIDRLIHVLSEALP